jgi:hypothetical protein
MGQQADADHNPTAPSPPSPPPIRSWPANVAQIRQLLDGQAADLPVPGMMVVCDKGLAGLWTRLPQRLLALNTVLGHDGRISAPVQHSLVAHDH